MIKKHNEDINIFDKNNNNKVTNMGDNEIPMTLKFCKEADIVVKRKQLLQFKFSILAKVEKMRYQGKLIDTMSKVET